jgi:GNAT superfamily N-acetyltransferase
MRCHLTEDVDEFLTAAGQFLAARPIEHNLLLTLAHARRDHPVPSRWAWITDGGVIGAAIQTPVTFNADLSPMPVGAVTTLVDGLAAVPAELPGVHGDALTTARFAGEWASARGVPAHPVEGQRLYRLGQPAAARRVPGALRRAALADRRCLEAWCDAFDEETGNDRPAGLDLPALLTRRINAGESWVWDVDGGPASMAFATHPVAGAVRIGVVYTPPERRGRGYASACVGGLSADVIAQGARHCLLFTQLSNPTSNALYQSLGYEPVGEVLRYRFGSV